MSERLFEKRQIIAPESSNSFTINEREEYEKKKEVKMRAIAEAIAQQEAHRQSIMKHLDANQAFIDKVREERNNQKAMERGINYGR